MNFKDGRRITDEEILSYLMGDASEELTNSINEMANNDPSFMEKIKIIGHIEKQVKLAPTECYVPVKEKNMMWKLAPTMCMLLISFSIGLFVQSKFLLIDPVESNEIHVNVEKEITRPMDLDENRSSVLL